MNLSLIKKTFREQRNSLLIYIGFLILYIYLLIAIFPSISKVEGLEQFMENLPEQMIELFGGAELSYATIEGFLAMEFFSFMWIVIVGAYVFSAAASIVAAEIEKGTMDQLLAQPVKRFQIILSKVLVLIVNTGILVAVTMGSIWAGVEIKNLSMSYDGLWALALLGFCFFLAIAGYTMLFSSFLREKSKAVFLSVGLTLSLYIFHALAGLSDKIKDYKEYGLFYYYRPQELLKDAQIDNWHIIILLSIFVVCLIAVLFIFKKRDV